MPIITAIIADQFNPGSATEGWCHLNLRLIGPFTTDREWAIFDGVHPGNEIVIHV